MTAVKVVFAVAVLLFLTPCIYGSKEDKDSYTEDKPNNNGVSEVMVNEPDERKSNNNVAHLTRREPKVKNEDGRQTEDVYDEYDYYNYPPCGDKPMSTVNSYTCYCGNRTLSPDTDLRDGEYYCCVTFICVCAFCVDCLCGWPAGFEPPCEFTCYC